MVNEAIADIFLEIADLLDLEGVAFKPEAYRRAARALLQAPDEVAALLTSGRLAAVPGVGEAITEKIREYVTTGSVPYLEKLRAQWPPGLLQLMRLEGIGPKTTRRFYTEFHVEGLDDLQRLLEGGKLRGVYGFGDRKLELLSKAVQKARAPASDGGSPGRLPLPEAQALADELLVHLRGSGAPIERIVFAGSLRRRRETVGDLDLLATSTRPQEVMEQFVHFSGVEEVKLSGPTKSTVVLHGGFQVDLRVVPSASFGAALQYFTGSKDHNVRIRSIANKKGFSINEYGLTRGEQLVPSPTEEEVYAAVGLPWIPPELREAQGEVEAAAEGKLPVVVGDAEVKGELHVHVPATAAGEDLAPWVEAAQELGHRYLGVVVRNEDAGRHQLTAREVRAAIPREVGGLRILLGWEFPPLPSQVPLGTEPDIDYRIVVPPEPAAPDAGKFLGDLAHQAKEGPIFLGHATVVGAAVAGLSADVIGRMASPLPIEVAVDHAEVKAPTSFVRALHDRRVPVVLSGLPRQPEELPRLALAAGIARRGWTSPEQVLNASTSPFELGSSRPARDPGDVGPSPPPSSKRKRRS